MFMALMMVMVMVSWVYLRGPQPPGHGPLPVCSLLGTRLHSRRWAVSNQSFICRSPSHYLLNHPRPPPTRGKIVSHETRPWCQKGWGPLVYLMPKFIKLYTLNMCSFLYLNNTSIKCFLKKLSILHFAHAEEFCLCCRIRRGRVTSSL